MGSRISTVVLGVLVPVFLAGTSVQSADFEKNPNLKVVKSKRGYPMPAGGFIQNEAMAIGIGEIVLKSVFKAEDIDSKKPLKAELVKGVWIVRDTQRDGWKGGVAEVWISKETGEIIKVIYNK